MTSDQLSEICRKIIEDNQWQPIDFNTLDNWTRSIIRSFFAGLNTHLEIAPEDVDGAQVIKIDDPTLKYLISMPYKCYDGQINDQFYWMIGDNPNNNDHGIHPDTAMAYLLQKRFPDMIFNERELEDGSRVTKMEINGKTIDVTFPPEFFDNNTYRKDHDCN